MIENLVGGLSVEAAANKFNGRDSRRSSVWHGIVARAPQLRHRVDTSGKHSFFIISVVIFVSFIVHVEHRYENEVHVR